MTFLTSYLIAFYSLFLISDAGKQSTVSRTVQPGEWLLFESLDLQLNGPCYDVAFYQDDILFLKSGEESLYLTPMLSPDPGNSQPLYLNRDISCSPAAISFSGDYSKGYYTRPAMGKEQVFLERIFEMSVEGNSVSGISQLPFSQDPSRNLHPAVSRDASMMIFSSDRLTTNGGLDLFVTHQSTDGWTNPVNMGDFINTSGHEWFPFLDHKNNLWFSSTGHVGYGGFDIFFCAFKDGEWESPQNLGSAINGPQNELGFSVHPLKQVAVFSRTWPAGDKGEAIMIVVNEEALDAAGIDESAARDIILLLKSTADPPPPSESDAPPEQEVVPEPVSEEKTATPDNNQDRVVFRVQIISSQNENSFPTVLIDGVSYGTHEYYYLDAYRITVGKFYSLEEAKAFRVRCLASGFKQAFVAAFRRGERVTDPEVFKQ
jgi:hypothetical protein